MAKTAQIVKGGREHPSRYYNSALVTVVLPNGGYEKVLSAIRQLERTIQMNAAEMKVKLQALDAKLTKVQREQLSMRDKINEQYVIIADLREKLNQGGANDPEIAALLTKLEGTLDAMDAVVPDPANTASGGAGEES